MGEEERPSAQDRRDALVHRSIVLRVQLWGILAGKMGICGAFWRKMKLMAGNYPSVTDTVGPLNVLRFFISSRVPERASESRGWPGLAGWMKAQIRAKTRNRGRGWAEYHRPDEKNDLPGDDSGTRLEML
jgi:hypothetical protein